MSHFEALYEFNYTSPELVNSWEDKRMTGFKLSWLVQDSKGSHLTNSDSDTPSNWKPKEAISRYQDRYLNNMVNLANIARVNNLTGSEVMDKVINFKAKKAQWINQNKEYCVNGRLKKEDYKPMKKDWYNKLFSDLSQEFPLDSFRAPITEKDQYTGFMIFSAMVYCPEVELKLFQFFHNLLLDQSPRTIIKATVNTILAAEIKEGETRKRLNKFYLALDKVFNLELGRILLAISSQNNLYGMIDRDMPWITKYSKEIYQCLDGHICEGIIGIVQSSG